MKALLLKELKSVFCSVIGVFFALAFFGISGFMLWVFDGHYNLIGSGYASLDHFFSLAPILFLILIPALMMRQFADENKSKTLDVLRARPVSLFQIYSSKFIASLLFILVILFMTGIYVYSLYQLANPVGNVDLTAIFVSYISLFFLAAVFIAIGLFASAITKNQVVAFIIAVFIGLFSFYGFNLLGTIFLSGKIQSILTSFGLLSHYELMQRGVVYLNDLQTIFNYIFLFPAFTILVLTHNRKRLVVRAIPILIIINAFVFLLPNIRVDFTQDKRYTLSDYSKKVLAETAEKKQPFKINIWLEGDLNSRFQYLQDAVKDLLSDLNKYSDNQIVIEYKNPYKSFESLQQMYEQMATNGMGGIVLNEIDREGKASRKMIYPYAQMINSGDTLVVPLLKSQKGASADENINMSVENLEFQFIDAFRLLNQKERKDIAFIEGHGELSRAYLYNAEELLSKYYFVNRGQIGTQIGVLDNFDAVIIAGPTERYSEEEKFIIDQYIMSGGKILWLINGAYYSYDDLSSKGQSVSIKNDTNLDDLLFSYGVRVNPDFVQDKQCVSIYMITDEAGHTTTTLPCYYIPLLMPSPDNAITKGINDVRAPFSSSIDIVNKNDRIRKSVLLTTSADGHIINVPDYVTFDIYDIQSQKDYFNQPYIPVALSMEGIFNSAFTNRMLPDGLNANSYSPKKESRSTKMIVVASSGIIRNEIEGQNANTQIVPMGYDRVLEQQFGNPDFIVNAVNWLTNDEGWTQLRSKHQQLRILNKKEAFENRNFYAILNIVAPVLFMLVLIGGISLYRKQKYEKNINL